jgi:hypothetical protein
LIADIGSQQDAKDVVTEFKVFLEVSESFSFVDE